MNQSSTDKATSEKLTPQNQPLSFQEEFQVEVKPTIQQCIKIAGRALLMVYGGSHQIPKNASVQLGLSIYHIMDHEDFEDGNTDLQALAKQSVLLAINTLNLDEEGPPSIEYILRENIVAVATLASTYLMCFADEILSDPISSQSKPQDDSMAELEVGGHHPNMPVCDSLDEAWATFAGDGVNPAPIEDNWPGQTKLKEFGEP